MQQHSNNESAATLNTNICCMNNCVGRNHNKVGYQSVAPEFFFRHTPAQRWMKLFDIGMPEYQDLRGTAGSGGRRRGLALKRGSPLKQPPSTSRIFRIWSHRGCLARRFHFGERTKRKMALILLNRGIYPLWKSISGQN